MAIKAQFSDEQSVVGKTRAPGRQFSRLDFRGVNFDHIKGHYYITHDTINPTRLVRRGPILGLDLPHVGEKLRQ